MIDAQKLQTLRVYVNMILAQDWADTPEVTLLAEDMEQILDLVPDEFFFSDDERS